MKGMKGSDEGVVKGSVLTIDNSGVHFSLPFTKVGRALPRRPDLTTAGGQRAMRAFDHGSASPYQHPVGRRSCEAHFNP